MGELCRKHDAAEKHLLVEYDTGGRHMDNSIVNATYGQIKEWAAEHYNVNHKKPLKDREIDVDFRLCRKY